MQDQSDDGRERGQAGQQGREPPGVQVASGPARPPLLADRQVVHPLDSAALHVEPSPGTPARWRTCGSQGALVAGTRKACLGAVLKRLRKVHCQSRRGAHSRHHGSAHHSHGHYFWRTARTGPSKRPPQPGSEVFVQRAPEWLLERLLEAPVACSKHWAQLLQASGSSLCRPADSAHLQTVGSRKACVTPRGLHTRSLARWTAHACRTCINRAAHVL